MQNTALWGLLVARALEYWRSSCMQLKSAELHPEVDTIRLMRVAGKIRETPLYASVGQI